MLQVVYVRMPSQRCPSPMEDSNFPPILTYEVRSDNKVTDAVTLSPKLVDHASIPHMEAMNLPFHLQYSNPICRKK